MTKIDKTNSEGEFRFLSYSELFPLLFIVLASIVILPISSVDVHNNTAIYLRLADNIAEGESIAMVFPEFDSTRGPLYPALLATGFKLLGKTVHSASIVTRAFFSLGIVLIYLLGRVFYGRTTGVLASILVMTSHGINFIAEFIDTDIVLPVFILLFILLYYLSLERRRWYFASLAGVSLALALMVKESALLCFGILLGMSVLASKGKRFASVKKSLLLMATATITLIPWMLIIFKTHGSLLPMLGVAHPDVFQHLVGASTGSISPFSYWIDLLTLGLKDALCLFYHNFLRKTSGLAPLMIAGWIVLLIKGLFYRKNNSLILAISVICFLPLILYTADTQDRLGQTTIVYMIMYIGLANLVVSGIPFLVKYADNTIRSHSTLAMFRRRTENLVKVNDRIVILTGILLVGSQLFGHTGSTWRKWTRGQNSLTAFSWKAFDAHGRFTNDQQEAAEWLKKNLTESSKIIADGYSTEPLEFFDAVNYKVPLFKPKEGMSIAFGTADKRVDNARPLYLFTYSGFESGAQRHRIIYPIYEEDIVEAIRGECPDYLVISWRSLFYSEYFDKAVWADLSFANDTVRIYKIYVEKFEPIVFENIGVNDTIREHLEWLKRHYPDEYTLLEKKLNIFGLTVEELVNSPLMFPGGQIY